MPEQVDSSAFVTKEYLDLRLDRLSGELRAEFHKEFRDQTWKLIIAMFAVQTLYAGIVWGAVQALIQKHP